VTRVNEIMTSGVVTVEARASCHDAVTQMVRNKIRHLPVVEGTGTLCGIVTDRDLRHQLFAPQMFRSIGTVPVEELLAATPVRNVMSSPVISVGPDTDLQEAARMMAELPPEVSSGRVTFSDENATKGGLDVRFAITVSLRGRRRLHVEDRATSPRQALDGALRKLERRLTRTQGMDREKRRRPKKYYAAARLR